MSLLAGRCPKFVMIWDTSPWQRANKIWDTSPPFFSGEVSQLLILHTVYWAWQLGHLPGSFQRGGVPNLHAVLKIEQGACSEISNLSDPAKLKIGQNFTFSK